MNYNKLYSGPVFEIPSMLKSAYCSFQKATELPVKTNFAEMYQQISSYHQNKPVEAVNSIVTFYTWVLNYQLTHGFINIPHDKSLLDNSFLEELSNATCNYCDRQGLVEKVFLSTIISVMKIEGKNTREKKPKALNLLRENYPLGITLSDFIERRYPKPRDENRDQFAIDVGNAYMDSKHSNKLTKRIKNLYEIMGRITLLQATANRIDAYNKVVIQVQNKDYRISSNFSKSIYELSAHHLIPFLKKIKKDKKIKELTKILEAKFGQLEPFDIKFSNISQDLLKRLSVLDESNSEIFSQSILPAEYFESPILYTNITRLQQNKLEVEDEADSKIVSRLEM